MISGDVSEDRRRPTASTPAGGGLRLRADAATATARGCSLQGRQYADPLASLEDELRLGLTDDRVHRHVLEDQVS